MAGRISSSPRGSDLHQRVGSRTPERAPERPRVAHNIQRLTQAETDNKFYVDLDNVPVEYEAEWKRVSIVGAPDTRNMAISRRNGWEPAPRGNHPEIMGIDGIDATADSSQPIIIDGLMLCYRPWDVSEEAHRERVENTAYTTQQMIDAVYGESMAQVGKAHTRYTRRAEPMPGNSAARG